MNSSSSLPGARDVNANREVMITSLPIRYRHAELAAAGLSPADAAEQVRRGHLRRSRRHGESGHPTIRPRRPARLLRIARVHRAGPRPPASWTGVARPSVSATWPTLARSDRAISSLERTRSARPSSHSTSPRAHNLGELVAAARANGSTRSCMKPDMTVSYGGQFEAQQSAARRP